MAAPIGALQAQLSSAGNVTGSGVPTTTGVLGGQTQAPAGTVSAPNQVGTSNTDQTSLTNFMNSYLQQYATQSQGIISSAQDASSGLNQAIQGLQGQETSFNSGIQQGLQGALSNQATQFGGTLINAAPKLGTGGLSQNAASLQQLQNDNAATIKQLQQSADAAMASGDVNFATSISGLQAQQYTMMLNAKEQLYQGLAAEGSSVAAISQAQTAQAQQQETTLNDMASLASQYGVTVKPGDSMADIINEVAPKAAAKEALTIGTMQSQINQNNASAALARAQASVIAPQTPADMSSLFTAINDSVPGSDQQKNLTTALSSLFTNNPQNITTYSNIVVGATDRTWNLTPTANGGMSSDMTTLASMASNAQAAGLGVDQAIQSYVTNNPYMSPQSKAQASEFLYASYGVTPPPTNPWSQVFGELQASVTQNVLNAGQGSSNNTPWTTWTSQVGAQQFARSNPGKADMPGANPYVNAMVGNVKTSYNEYLQQSGSGNFKGINVGPTTGQ